MYVPTLRVGDRVVIVRGQLAGLSGVVSSFTLPEHRCVLDMDHFERGITVLIDSESVRLTDASPKTSLDRRMSDSADHDLAFVHSKN
jgi:hypothetical protein